MTVDFHISWIYSKVCNSNFHIHGVYFRSCSNLFSHFYCFPWILWQSVFACFTHSLETLSFVKLHFHRSGVITAICDNRPDDCHWVDWARLSVTKCCHRIVVISMICDKKRVKSLVMACFQACFCHISDAFGSFVTNFLRIVTGVGRTLVLWQANVWLS